jgi:predicted RNA-binding protein with PIN domain
MAYIIDGNNLIGSAPDFSLVDPESRGKNPINAKLTVVYPRYGLTADDEIKRILDGYQQLKEIILVSTDRELKKYAKEKGARTINSIEFYFTLKKAFLSQGKKEETLKRVNTRVSQNEVEQWLKIFNGD